MKQLNNIKQEKSNCNTCKGKGWVKKKVFEKCPDCDVPQKEWEI